MGVFAFWPDLFMKSIIVIFKYDVFMEKYSCTFEKSYANVSTPQYVHKKHIFCIKLNKYAKVRRVIFWRLFKTIKYVHVFVLTNTSKYAYGCRQRINTRIRPYLIEMFYAFQLLPLAPDFTYILASNISQGYYLH